MNAGYYAEHAWDVHESVGGGPALGPSTSVVGIITVLGSYL